MISTLPNIERFRFDHDKLSVEIMALRKRNNKDIKGFQITIDEQTHSIKISQLADTIF
jgi:hypothetical protein